MFLFTSIQCFKVIYFMLIHKQVICKILVLSDVSVSVKTVY